jgi:bifunctional non-homologous end joining protein LigD
MIIQLSVKQAIAVPDERGVTNISLLDDALATGALGRLAFYAFDLLILNGKDLGAKPLAERKLALSKLLANPPPRLLYSEHLACNGRALFEQVGELGCEGIVSKHIDAPYASGPSKTWLKCKHSAVGAFSVVGYVPDGEGIEALLIAEKHGGGLRPAGLVEFRRPGVLNDDAHQALGFLTRPEPCIRIGRSSSRVRWVEPRLIATVKYFGRTGTGALRAAVLQDLSLA